MKHLIALALLCAPLFAQAPPHTVTLTWTWAQCTSATPPVCEGLATGFTVYKAPATTGTTCPAASALTQIATTTPVIVAASSTYTYIDSNSSPSTSILTEGVTYCYAVTATDSLGASPFSPIASATVPFSVPESPLSVGAVAK